MFLPRVEARFSPPVMPHVGTICPSTLCTWPHLLSEALKHVCLDPWSQGEFVAWSDPKTPALPTLGPFGVSPDPSHPLLPFSLLQVSASPDPSSPREEERTLLLPRTRLQAGPRQHRRRALSEPAALSLDKASMPRTLEDTPLLLELQKLPGLANTDLTAPNPNIQVRATGGHRPSGHLERNWADRLHPQVRRPHPVFLGGRGFFWGSQSSGGCSSTSQLWAKQGMWPSEPVFSSP